MDIDWTHGREHMLVRHGVSEPEATEAVADPRALLLDPDPKSKSGQSARILGFSPSARAVLAIIVVRRVDKPDAWWGASGWPANPSEVNLYNEEADDE